MRELPFPRDPEEREEHDVDGERPDRLVPPRQAEVNEVVRHV